jgi:hypothetical protein
LPSVLLNRVATSGSRIVTVFHIKTDINAMIMLPAVATSGSRIVTVFHILLLKI